MSTWSCAGPYLGTSRVKLTCCADLGAGRDCRWLGTKRFGQTFRCSLFGETVVDDAGGVEGFLRPCSSCVENWEKERDDAVE